MNRQLVILPLRLYKTRSMAILQLTKEFTEASYFVARVRLSAHHSGLIIGLASVPDCTRH